MSNFILVPQLVSCIFICLHCGLSFKMIPMYGAIMIVSKHHSGLLLHHIIYSSRCQFRFVTTSRLPVYFFFFMFTDRHYGVTMFLFLLCCSWQIWSLLYYSLAKWTIMDICICKLYPFSYVLIFIYSYKRKIMNSIIVTYNNVFCSRKGYGFLVANGKNCITSAKVFFCFLFCYFKNSIYFDKLLSHR